MTMPRTTPQFSAMAVALAGSMAAFGFSLFAQTPPQAPAPGPPAGAAGQGAGRGGFTQDNTGADFSPKPPVQPRSAAEEARSFLLPAGYRMELVLSDPDIVSPGVIEFDGNGRMYV